MATQWQTFAVPFTGGLITNISPLQQGINNVGSAYLLQNFEPSLDGGYRKVAGYEKFISAVLPGSGVVQGLALVQQDGNEKVIAVRNGVYYIADATDATPSWTSMATASNVSFSKVRQARYNFNNAYKICFVDGVNFPAYYDRASDTVTYMTTSATNDAVEGASHVCLFKSTHHKVSSTRARNLHDLINSEYNKLITEDHQTCNLRANADATCTVCRA